MEPISAPAPRETQPSSRVPLSQEGEGALNDLRAGAQGDAALEPGTAVTGGGGGALNYLSAGAQRDAALEPGTAVRGEGGGSQNDSAPVP